MNSEESTDQAPAPSLARALIRSLTRGTGIAEGARYIHVGHEKWLLAQRELLGEIAEDGHADTKFVRGAYGAGKSHFLSMVQDMARQHGWATSHVECKLDGVQIDRFETVYPQIARRLSTGDLTSNSRGGSEHPHPTRFVLEKWAREQAQRAGVREGALTRPFDADARLHSQLEQGLLRSNLPPDFIRAQCAFARAYLDRDAETMGSVCSWISGTDQPVSIPSHLLQKPDFRKTRDSDRVAMRPIGKGSARDAMRGLLWLIKAAGYKGLVLCIDEIEELTKLGSRKRQDQALQALREYVDHAGGEGGFYYLCMYLAATPEMFEGEDYFPRYDALATRIQAVSSEVNWRSPVIDLDRTPLKTKEMREMALRIRDVYRVAYPSVSSVKLTDTAIQQLLRNVIEAKFRIAKPRLLARVVVDALERDRQGALPKRLSDLGNLVETAASAITRESGV